METLGQIKKSKTKRIAYSKNVLDGIDYIDDLTCYELIKSLIPSTIHTSPTPYRPIRQLINFFDAHSGAKAKLKSGKRFIDVFSRFSALVDILSHINCLDNEIYDIIYTKKRNYSPTELFNQIKWRMDDLLNSLRTFMVELDKNGMMRCFENEEVVNGSPDGKRVGLYTILFNSNKGMEEITDFFESLEKIIKKGRNPFSYYTY